jgi:hypothetical protein
MSSDVSTPIASRERFRVRRLREYFPKDVRLKAREVIVGNNPFGIGAPNGDRADSIFFGFKLADFMDEIRAAQGFGFHGFKNYTNRF